MSVDRLKSFFENSRHCTWRYGHAGGRLDISSWAFRIGRGLVSISPLDSMPARRRASRMSRCQYWNRVRLEQQHRQVLKLGLMLGRTGGGRRIVCTSHADGPAGA
jgi:hypothetical protein